MRKVAVIGAGIAGLNCALQLCDDFAVTLFEKEDRIGGHAHTVDIEHNGRQEHVDIGFMVYNRRNYPTLCALLEKLGVEGRPTAMSFSVAHEDLRLEYNGGSLTGLVAEAGNLTRANFWRLLADILRFNRIAKRDLRRAAPAEDESLGDYLRRLRMSHQFAAAYLLPMGASIWSCGSDDFYRAPAIFALSFFNSHGLLDVLGRPQWMTIAGGSRCYTDKLRAVFNGDVRTSAGVEAVRRRGDGFMVATAGGEQQFDAVVFALHAPDALALLASDATTPAAEREVLAAFRYTDNDAVMHDDMSILPTRKRGWAAWNYRIIGGGDSACVTYNLSMLQGFGEPLHKPLLLTLNPPPGRIDDGRVLYRFRFNHPLPDFASLHGRARWDEVNGGDSGTFFCGAYWGNGFHEDGAASGARAAAALRDYFHRRADIAQ